MLDAENPAARWAAIGNLRISDVEIMKRTSPSEWARTRASNHRDPHAKIIEQARVRLTKEFLFPMIDAAGDDVLGFLHQVMVQGLKENDLFAILGTALEFDRANALFHMKIFRHDPLCPAGMPWNAADYQQEKFARLQAGVMHPRVADIYPLSSMLLQKHRPTINPSYVQLLRAEGKDEAGWALQARLRPSLRYALEFMEPQWLDRVV